MAGKGICMLGDYEETEGNVAFTATLQKNLEKVVKAACRRYNIERNRVSYHRVV